MSRIEPLTLCNILHHMALMFIHNDFLRFPGGPWALPIGFLDLDNEAI